MEGNRRINIGFYYLSLSSRRTTIDLREEWFIKLRENNKDVQVRMVEIFNKGLEDGGIQGKLGDLHKRESGLVTQVRELSFQ